jgi:RNA polymerase sigma factor (sigma-70 family)
MNSPTTSDAAEAHEMRIALARDFELIGRGDSNAMARVYASTSPKLNALLIRMLGDPLEAEEVLQNVYLAVWRRGAIFDPTRASPITWLVTIARNRAIDRIRANKAARRSAILGSLDGQQATQSTETALDGVEKDEDRRRLHMCLEALEAHAKAGD